MKKEISRNLKINQILSCVSILIGIILLAYMIKVEGEPGALPLFLIVAGAVWFFMVQYKVKKSLG